MAQEDYQTLFQPQGIRPPSSLPGYVPNSQFSTNPFMGGGRMPHGIGNLLMQWFGSRMWPVTSPGGQQSMYDAGWQREHDIQLASLSNKTVAAWYPFQNLGGMNENSAVTQIVSNLMSNPDGITSKIMAPLLGGNPIAAQMSSYAALQGIGGSGLGSGRGVSVGQLMESQKAFDQEYYKQDIKPINQGLARQYAEPVRQLAANPKLLKLLDLTPEDILGSFDQYNQVHENTRAVDRIAQVHKAITGVQQLMGTEITDEPLTANKVINTLDKEGLGNSYAPIVDAIKRSFDGVKIDNKAFSGALGADEIAKKMDPKLRDEMTSLASGDGSNISLKNLETLLDKFTKPDSGKLSPEEISQYTGAFYAALTRATPEIAARFGQEVEAPPIQEAAAGLNNIGQSMLIQHITRGMDFSKNLGLGYNTLTTARDEFVKNRLISPTNDSSGLSDYSKLFAGGGKDIDKARLPSLITAAKGLWGNDMPDKELMQNVSDYVGNSIFDANNPKDTERLETSFRQLKSTARESNMSVNSLLNLQKQAQAMASQNPNLEHLGGIEIGDMVSQSAQDTAAIATDNSLSNNWMIRSLGGTEGMLASSLEHKLTAAANPTIMAATAVRTYIKQNTKDEKQRNDLLIKYDKWAAGDDGSRSQIGLLSFMRKNFTGTELSADMAWNASANNELAAQQAREDNPDLFDQLPLGMEVDTIRASLTRLHSGTEYALDKNQAGILGPKYKEGQKMTAVELHDAYVNENKLKDLLLDKVMTKDSAQPFGVHALMGRAVRAGVYTPTILRNNTHIRDNATANKDAINTGADLERAFERTLAPLRQGAITGLAQAFAGGDFSMKGAVEPFLKVIGVGPDSQHAFNLLNLSTQMNKLSGAQTVEDVAYAVGVTGKTSIDGKYKDNTDILKEISTEAEAYGFNGNTLELIAKDKTLIGNAGGLSKYLNKSSYDKLAKTPGATNNLVSLARGAADLLRTPTLDASKQPIKDKEGNVKYDYYQGELNTEGLKGHYKQEKIAESLNKLWVESGVESNFEKLVGEKIDKTATGVDGTGVKAMGEYLKEISEQENPETKKKMGYAKGLEQIMKMQQDQPEMVGDQGKYALPSSVTKFISNEKIMAQLPEEVQTTLKGNLNKDNEYIFKDKESASTTLASIKKLANQPIIQALGSKAADLNQLRTDFDKTAQNPLDLQGTVKAIYGRLEGLKEITQAILKLTGAIKGE